MQNGSPYFWSPSVSFLRIIFVLKDFPDHILHQQPAATRTILGRLLWFHRFLQADLPNCLPAALHLLSNSHTLFCPYCVEAVRIAPAAALQNHLAEKNISAVLTETIPALFFSARLPDSLPVLHKFVKIPAGIYHALIQSAYFELLF